MNSAQYDQKEGFGILQHKNGEKYEGSWKNNLANGLGTLYYSDGDKYVGKNDPCTFLARNS